MALLPAHPNTLTLFIFFHHCLFVKFLHLLIDFSFFPSFLNLYIHPCRSCAFLSFCFYSFSCSFLFDPFFFRFSSCAQYSVLFSLLSLTLSLCPAVHNHLSCVVPQYLFPALRPALMLPPLKTKMKSLWLLFCTQGKLFSLLLTASFFNFNVSSCSCGMRITCWENVLFR